MDVNPNRAPWVWVRSDDLIAAMRTFDTVENRGYHYGDAGMDMNSDMALEGTVAECAFRNPHVQPAPLTDSPFRAAFLMPKPPDGAQPGTSRTAWPHPRTGPQPRSPHRPRGSPCLALNKKIQSIIITVQRYWSANRCVIAEPLRQKGPTAPRPSWSTQTPPCSSRLPLSSRHRRPSADRDRPLQHHLKRDHDVLPAQRHRAVESRPVQRPAGLPCSRRE